MLLWFSSNYHIYLNVILQTTRRTSENNKQSEIGKGVLQSKNASIGEKASAWLITTITKGKQRLGMGCKSIVVCKRKNMSKKMRKVRKNSVKKTAFGVGIVRKVREDLKKADGNRLVVKDTKGAVNIALKAARKHLKELGGKRNIRTSRVIPIPKVDGILPLIPILTTIHP